MSQSALLRIAACGLTIGIAGVASADVLHNTFGLGDSYQEGGHWGIGTQFGNYAQHAMPFDVGAGTFDNLSLTIPLSWSETSSPGDFAFDVIIYMNDGDSDPLNTGENGPGTELTSLSLLASDLPAFNGPLSLSVFDFDDLTLPGNARYWLSIESDRAHDGTIQWFLNDQELLGIEAQRVAPGSNDLQDWFLLPGNELSAFRITGDAIPAPGAMTLLGIGGLAAMRRCR